VDNLGFSVDWEVDNRGGTGEFFPRPEHPVQKG